jgi:AraC family transcriptional regulator of adaptative response / DNA-3-methyladenine glycosylase II
LPGLRVPGAFDGFELAVRAVLGQQVSVKAATTMAGRWAHAFGAAIATPFVELNRLTPAARRLEEVSADEIASLGIIGSRSRCIAALAGAVRKRTVILGGAADVESQIEGLMRLPGIGAWTAQYIAMRALRWPDAFPGTDLMLLRAAGLNAKQLHARAESWRPWRAYATHYLWQSLGVSP